MKQIRLTENDLHRIISESVKKVLSQINELDSKTYIDAANKAKHYGQRDRVREFEAHATRMFNKKTGEIKYYEFKIYRDGFEISHEADYLGYDKDRDQMYILFAGQSRKLLEPGDYHLRLRNRSLIRKILAYFNEFAPDSQYNDKNLWIE